ncbi:MAG: hypothetical protein OXH22_07130 [Chloroflexi bacterium]|nr:hypothetical protein [Chloroflexota bacterium]
MKKRVVIPAAMIFALIGAIGLFDGPRLIGGSTEGEPAATEALATAIAANNTAIQAFATAVSANDAAVRAFATAVAPSPTVDPTALTPTAEPTIEPTVEPTVGQTPTVTPVPSTPTPTSTPTDDEIELATPIAVPVGMVGAWWNWNATELDEITVNVETHNDIKLTGDNGIYLFNCQGDVNGTLYYFGLQTDVQGLSGGRGKGVIFSRWGERDLANAKIPDGGWMTSSGHEGNFIGVRGSYDWGEGQYQVRIGKDGDDDSVGRWYGVWITDLSTSTETWIGSLRFPHAAGWPPRLSPQCYNVVEVYGVQPIAPKDIPYWKVTVGPILGDGQAGTFTTSTSSGQRDGVFRNSRFTMVDEDKAITYEVGLDYIPEDR